VTEQNGVCLVLRYFTIGGLERVVSLLANELAARGVPVRVIVLGTARRNALITELSEDVETHVLTGPWQNKLRRLRQLTAGNVVHLHFGDGKIHPSVRWALRNHPDVVLTYHSVYSHKRTWLTNTLDRVTSRHLRSLVAVSDAVAGFCEREVGLAPERITVINNAVPEPSQGEFEHRREPGLWLIDLASVYPHKNHRTLIRGLAVLRERGHDVRLRVIGDGPDVADLFQEATQLGVAGQVDWYGAVWRREIVSSLLATSDVFVTASRYEGTPLTALESMQMGLPLVLSDIPAHRETGGDAAAFFPADDPVTFADQVEPLLDDAFRAERGVASRDRGDHFSVSKFVDSHVDVYRSCPPTLVG
jgi:glycosyltransferase involved in cell wall biosynthesis